MPASAVAALGLLSVDKLRGRAFKGRDISCQGRNCGSEFVTHGLADTLGEEQEWRAFRCPRCAKGDPRYVSLYNRCHKCRRAACFGTPGSSPGGAMRCSRHREAGMVDVRHPLCEYHEGCKKRAQYGGETGQRHLFCGEHRQTHHADLSHKQCRASGCSKRALFGNATSGPQTCREHRFSELGNLPSQECAPLAVGICFCTIQSCVLRTGLLCVRTRAHADTDTDTDRDRHGQTQTQALAHPIPYAHM
eukprot:Tamp_16719.p1 GENE.Tamp_16719~~Tamp_16719.p1  ORF type:complete len:248 (-),score=2.97 Tamp_16719:536-1279(-)